MNTTTKTNSAAPLGTAADKAQPSLEVAVQFAVEELDCEEPPSSQLIVEWAQAAFSAHNCVAEYLQHDNKKATEVTVRLVDTLEMTELNQVYRGKSGATNVLSFPAQLPPELTEALEMDLLGDIVICHSVVIQEARQQQKVVSAHYAHMVTHGVLHLCGYDHEDDVSAREMEGLESKILAANGISDPYC